MRAAEDQIGIGGRLRNGHELCHGPEGRIQTVELIAEPAGAGQQSAVGVECAINPAIVREIHERSSVRNQEVNCVLVGMDPGDIATSVYMSEVDERVCCRAVAGGKDHVHPALV